MKIDIKIENDQQFAEVAFLVDRDDFQADIAEIRKLLGIKHFPYTFPKYSYAEANQIANLHATGQISIDGARALLEDFCVKAGLPNLHALDTTLARAGLFAQSLAEKYKKNYLYIPVMVGAVVGNRVREEDFRSTQVLEISNQTFQELGWIEKGKEIMTIRVNPESTPKEVGEVFGFIQKYYFKTRPIEEGSGLNTVYNNLPRCRLPDSTSNIRRNRDWYWLKKDDWSYRKIQKSYPKIIDLRGVELAIDRYAARLKEPL